MLSRSRLPLFAIGLLSLGACAAPSVRPAEHASVSTSPPPLEASVVASSDRVTPAAPAMPDAANTTPPPPKVQAPLHVVKLALGGNASFALMSDGTLRNWGGSDGVAKLALDGKASHLSPVPLGGLQHVIDITTSGIIACARTSDAGTYCWGRDIEGDRDPKGQNMGSSYTPSHYKHLDEAQEISISYTTPCAVVQGKATCTGSSLGAQSIAVAGNLFSGTYGCAVKTNGTLGCFGMFIGNEWTYDCCGDENGGLHTLYHSGVDEVKGLRAVERFRMSDTHACAIANGGTLYCWGFGGAGQLGNGKYGSPYAELNPQTVKEIEGVEDVAVGASFTCARKHGGKVACWGTNDDGQLGLGDTRRRILPTEVPGLADVVELAAGDRHACARTEAGAVLCWGWNALGQLGKGKIDTVPTSSPVRIDVL